MQWLGHVNWEFTVSVVLGILAFAIGVYHLAGLREATRLAKDHAERLASVTHAVTKQLADLQGGLSTRYIGEFPYFIKDIVGLLEGASRRIVIFCDYPGYGYFSDPTEALNYEHMLDSKKASVDLSLTCLNSRSRIRLQKEQFPESGWKTWKEGNVSKVARFLATHAIGVNADEVTHAQFVNIQENLDADLVQRIFGEARTTEVDGYFPLHFWIVDDTAIFSIPTVTGPVIEYGFTTSDRTLIEAFQLIPGRYRRTTIVDEDELNVPTAATPTSPHPRTTPVP